MERRWWTLVVVCVAIFMLLVDITVVNVALPQIERDLSAGFTELQWVIDAYSLALATCVLNAGLLADLVGRRKVFAAGLSVFTLASFACGLAPSIGFLIGARAVQGVGGAVMFATSLALITQAFPPRERGTAFGIWGATTGVAVAFGPLVGGTLTTALSWRWIFFVNLPIGVFALAVTLWRVGEGRDPNARRPDLPGLATLSGGLFALVYALLEAERRGWSDPRIVGLMVAAAGLFAAFVAVETRQERPMVDLRLFRIPAFTGAQVAAFAVSASVFSLFLYLTLYLQNLEGYDALHAGLRLLPVSVASFLVAPLAGRASERVPPGRLIGAGLGLAAVGLTLFTRLSPDSGWMALLPGLIITGIGIGLVNPPLASLAIGVAPPERSGMASGVNNTFRQVGIATGIAALGTVFQSRVASGLESGLRDTPLGGRAGDLADAISGGAVGPVVRHVPAELRDRLATEAGQAFVGALDTLFLISASVALTGAILTLVLVRGRGVHHGDDETDRRRERDAEAALARR